METNRSSRISGIRHKDIVMEKEIPFLGKMRTLACDGKCEKAWGINRRPRVQFSEEDSDDFAYLGVMTTSLA